MFSKFTCFRHGQVLTWGTSSIRMKYNCILFFRDLFSQLRLLCFVAVQLLVMTNSLRPHGLQCTRFLCLWDFPGKNTGVGYHFLFQGGIVPMQGSNLHLLRWQADSLPLSYQKPLLCFNCFNGSQHIQSTGPGTIKNATMTLKCWFLNSLNS